MTGYIKIEAAEGGLECRCELSKVSKVDKIDIMSVIFKALEIEDNAEAAIMAAIAFAQTKKDDGFCEIKSTKVEIAPALRKKMEEAEAAAEAEDESED